MGAGLFEAHPEIVGVADRVLGYSVRELCLDADDQTLSRTLYTQPALYVVNALHLQQARAEDVDVDGAIGHSLGEYNALHAAGVFDFETGLRIVQRRAELFDSLDEGGMMAVLGDALSERIDAMLGDDAGVDIANYNHPEQVILSGDPDRLDALAPDLEAHGCTTVSLNVSGAFHSRYMEPVQDDFRAFVESFSYKAPQCLVLSNHACQTYSARNVADLLAAQVAQPVLWEKQVRTLLRRGVERFRELGPGTTLTRMIRKIQDTPSTSMSESSPTSESPSASASSAPVRSSSRPASDRLDGGRSSFCERYGVRHPYVAGAMYRGIASPELVVRMGRAGLLSFFGTGGLPMDRIERGLQHIQRELDEEAPYGANFLHNVEDPAAEQELASLYLRYDVPVVEASAFASATPALVRLRLKGARRHDDGRIAVGRRLIAKVSRPEVASTFLDPPPEHLVERLVDQGMLTEHEAAVAPHVSLADDLTVEADSGGHTDRSVSSIVVPTIALMRDRVAERYPDRPRVHVGAAGGIGAPASIAAAFTLGADYVLTGSVNQCTVEAGTSDAVKDLLAEVDIHDTTYAPAGDMFELGAKVQVMKRGVLFPNRANRLHSLYKQHDSLASIDADTRSLIQKSYFQQSLDAVWAETRDYIGATRPDDLAAIESNPKKKMAAVFKWYFAQTTRYALEGNLDRKVDFQVHCGPALGALNQWLDGTDLADWRNRHVDAVAERLIEAAQARVGDGVAPAFA